MNRPEPRPALQRSEDGSVHPAAPRVEPEQHLHPIPHAPAAASARTARADDGSAELTRSSPAYSGKPAKLAVDIPKDLRKQVRRLAERSGKSLDVVVTEALTQHVTERD